MTVTASTPLDLTWNGMAYHGWKVSDLQAAAVPAAAILAAAQAMLCRDIDAAAERLRIAVLTPGSGQAMEYQEVRAQAVAALADTAPTAAKYPMLAASVGVDVDPQTGAPAADVLGVARAANAQYQSWNGFGAAVRAARLKGKAAVAAATTLDAANAAYAAISWPALPAATAAT